MPVLAHTPEKIMERKALRINPAKTCQPIGAMYAALGIHGCLPHSHGSQGCCSYHRSHLTRHFKEPVMASTSSFTEGASVFGGAPNLRQALKTIFDVYDPQGVAVHTTCLSETIGDDLPSMIKKGRRRRHHPPGEMGHPHQYAQLYRLPCDRFCQYGQEHGYLFRPKARKKAVQSALNIIPGYVEPSDMREIKRMLVEMKVPATLFPDTSGVLDQPPDRKIRHVSRRRRHHRGPGPETGWNKASLALGPVCLGTRGRRA